MHLCIDIINDCKRNIGESKECKLTNIETHNCTLRNEDNNS